MSEDRKKVVALLIYLGSVFILGSLICPIAWNIFQIEWLQSFEYIQKLSFGKISNRVFMLVGIAGLWPLAKSLKCTSKDDFGLAVPKSTFWKEFTIGFLIGAVSLAVLAFIYYFIGLRTLKSGDLIERFIEGITKGIIAGIAVGLIEEIFFRGILTRLLSKISPFISAVIISSFIYAAVHFIKGDSDTNYTTVYWYSGFNYLKSSFGLYTDAKFIGSFLTLFAIGIFLAGLTLKRGHIALGAGIHGGWVCILRCNSKMTRTDEQSPYFWIVGNYDKFTGYGAFVWLTIICLLTWYFLEKRQQKSA